MSYFELSALSENINTETGLNHAVLQSLLNYAKAQINDPIEKNQDKYGWWAENLTDAVGCRDWTLARSKQTPETLSRVKTHTQKALQWLIDQRIVKSINIDTYFDDEKLIRLINIKRMNDENTEITL